MADAKQELLPGTLELLVLKTLSIGPLHGYAIVREIQRRSAEVLVVEEGSLYPALHRMERYGWIDAEWGLSESNRRAKYYRLTRSGRAELKARTESWSRMSGAIAQVLGLRPAPETRA
jgi:PadR family transcriptional regulator, regulatory protein PadR